MIICPNCGKIAAFNSYFNAYICDYCGWEKREKKNNIVYFKVRITKDVRRNLQTEAYKKAEDTTTVLIDGLRRK